MMWRVEDKETTQRIMREKILQLFRKNFDFGGSVTLEIDGIICVTTRSTHDSCDQIIVKLHDKLSPNHNVGVGINSANHGSGVGQNSTNHGSGAGLNSANESAGDEMVHSGGILRDYLVRRPAMDHFTLLKRLADRSVSDRSVNSDRSAMSDRSSETSAMKRKLIDENDNPVYVPSREQQQHQSAGEGEEKKGTLDLMCHMCDTEFESRVLLAAHLDTSHNCGDIREGSPEGEGSPGGDGSRSSGGGGMSSKRRKQSNPRRGVLVDQPITELECRSEEELVSEDQPMGELESRSDEQPMGELESRSEDEEEELSGSDIIRSLLQKQPGPQLNNGIQSALEAAILKGGVVRKTDFSSSGGALALTGRILPRVEPMKPTPKRQYDTDKVWKCPHCNSVTKGFESYSEHCRLAHKRHACPYCMQTFSQRVNRDRHLYNHTGEKPYDCIECGFGFTRRDALRKHQQRTRHGLTNGLELKQEAGGSEEVGLDLSMSSRQAKQEEEALGLVMDSKRKEDQNKVTPRSAQGVKRVAWTTMQADVDLSERSYRCDVCAETVSGSESFTEHCKVAHRRTPCIYCGRTFSQKGNMERHMRQHTGERPFRCQVCNSAYTRKETLKAHILQAHGDEALSSAIIMQQASPFSDRYGQNERTESPKDMVVNAGGSSEVGHDLRMLGMGDIGQNDDNDDNDATDENDDDDHTTTAIRMMMMSEANDNNDDDDDDDSYKQDGSPYLLIEEPNGNNDDNIDDGDDDDVDDAILNSPSTPFKEKPDTSEEQV